ncbi:MAG: alpha/beta fold hydrolase [Octadecabacter sp.]|nr:alpha/beta fold hydrolase [Octadecabacter sp.]
MTDKIQVKDATLNAHVVGEGPPIVCLHGLGMDMSIFGDLIKYFSNHKIIRFDLRGQGQSTVPEGPYTMGGLIADTEAVIDYYEVHDEVVFDLSIGGMIAQGLALKRLNQVRGLVLCATAAKFGQANQWHVRAATARTKGMVALVDEKLERWNVKYSGVQTRKLNRAQFISANPEGYAASCEAIAGSNFYTPTSSLRLATLGLGGDLDKSTPPDQVRETTDLIRGSKFQLIHGAGHLAPETHANVVAVHLHEFFLQIGHI